MKITRILISIIVLSTIISLVAYGTQTIKQKSIFVYDGDISVKINGENVLFRNVNNEITAPLLYNGTVYVPIRGISEHFKFNIDWEDANKTVNVDSVSEKIIFSANIDGHLYILYTSGKLEYIQNVGDIAYRYNEREIKTVYMSEDHFNSLLASINKLEKEITDKENIVKIHGVPTIQITINNSNYELYYEEFELNKISVELKSAVDELLSDIFSHIGSVPKDIYGLPVIKEIDIE